MNRLWLIAATAFTCVAAGQVPMPGQPDKGTPSIETANSLPLTYVGGDQRVSIGLDKDGNTQGELLGVFANNGERAIVAQGWWDRGGAGGAQFDYNWLFGRTLDEVRKDPSSAVVAKLSLAIDQNQDKDRRATLGFAVERKDFFINAFLARSISGARDNGTISNSVISNVTGTDEAGNFVQTQTETTTTVLRAQPYNYSLGLHAGHFLDAISARLAAGFDYDKGNQGAHGTRYSFSIDKYLGTRGWSVSGQGEHSEQKNPFGPNRSDNRWWLTLRYEFGGGGAFQPVNQVAGTEWIQRALHNPVSGHERTITTYFTRGKTSRIVTPGTKTYTAHRPVAQNDSASVPQDSSNNPIDVLANDSDPDGNPISITAVTQPAHGSAQIAGTRINYTPATGFAGTDQFTYTISDNKGLSATAQVTVTVVAPAAKPPVAQNDSATTPINTPVTINVLANDSDPNGYPLSVTAVTTPSHGAAAINANGSITYTPQTSYVGNDSFGYTINNGKGGTANATVTITVQAPAAQPPIAVDDSATTPFNTPVTINVLANDSDPNGLPLSVTAVTTPAHGSATLSSSGTVTYTPQANYSGSDSFGYTIVNSAGLLASATVRIVVGSPLPPTASNDSATTPYNTPVTINVLANDSDPSGLPLSVIDTTAPANGTAQINANGTITYTPNVGFSGSDSFNYTIRNSLGKTASAVVNVTVQIAPAPIAVNDAYSIVVTPTGNLVNQTLSVLANDIDPAGLPLAITNVTQPASGSVTINAGAQTLQFSAIVHTNDVFTFTYTITDPYGRTSTATVTYTGL